MSMDEQRVQAYDEPRNQAYRSLIEQLMWCEEGEATAVLQQQAVWVDAGLLEEIALEVERLKCRGKGKAAQRLQQIRGIVADWVAEHSDGGVTEPSEAEMITNLLGEGVTQLPQVTEIDTATSVGTEAAGRFLLETLQLVAGSKGNPQQVYPVWAQQQAQFNADLLAVLPPVVMQLLGNAPREQQRVIAAILVDFGNLIQQFPLGTRWINMELGIAAYSQALTVRTQTEMPLEWADTMNNLALAYSNRIRKDQAANLKQTVDYQQKPLTDGSQQALEISFTFLGDALKQIGTALSNGDVKQGYSFLEKHQHQLNATLLQVIPIFGSTYLNRDTSSDLVFALSSFGALGSIIIADDSSLGRRKISLEIAISVFQSILQAFSQKSLSALWTVSQFCSAYNIEQLIPTIWAATQNDLAGAYTNRILGDRADNIEQAIKSFKLALQVFTHKKFPEEWATTQNGLAGAYLERIKGDGVDNIEQVIRISNLILQIMTQKSSPEVWGVTQNNLGLAYTNRILGDRADNIEQAIKSFTLALQIRTYESFPKKWAMTQNNLGVAYEKRILGDRVDNFEHAIKSFKLALQVFTREVFPERWAQIQGNLGNMYMENTLGDRADSVEQAIEFFKLALQVFTREASPEEWAGTMMNLALAYSNRIRGERAENIKQAIVAYRASLEIFEPELFPNDCRRTARSLGNLYSEQHRWGEAEAIYQTALEAAERLYQSSNLLDGRAAELVETADLPRCAAYASARCGKFEKAVETLEQGRARGLSETLERDRADLSQLQQSRPDLFNQYQDITAQLRNLESQDRMRMTSEDRHSLTPEAYRNLAVNLRQQLTILVQQIREVPGYEGFLDLPSVEDVWDAVGQERPLVYLVSTPMGSLALIIGRFSLASLERGRADLLTVENRKWRNCPLHLLNDESH
ncbi:MAG: tetratricopeptide repeat protein [Oculatellaceae cyanobacterium bins.114]|nr:tetratricopeptide repeat protein [Oculatellaceae cyanobacterium bins.114]